MNWEAYLAGLSPEARLRAERLAGQHGRGAAEDYVCYNPVGSVAELEDALRRKRERVRTEVPGLYEEIDIHRPPAGWSP